jgi:hypothetical protein
MTLPSTIARTATIERVDRMLWEATGFEKVRLCRYRCLESSAKVSAGSTAGRHTGHLEIADPDNQYSNP